MSGPVLLGVLELTRFALPSSNHSWCHAHFLAGTVLTTEKSCASEYPSTHYTFGFFFFLLPRWKDNPAMPEGLVYEGVATEPLRYSGGSAAQSSVLQAFDEFLGIRHCKGSGKQQPGLTYSLKGRIRQNREAFLPTYKTRYKEQRTEVYPCLNHQTVVPMLVNIGASDFSRILGSFPSLNTKSWNGEHLGWSLSCGLRSLVCKVKG